ncbi:MAG: hypothetical protein Q8934_09665 [Bacillota bacterium]|nr:hypothetical protein [Bacillota bacterium]
MLDGLRFGDHIRVRSNGVLIDTNGIFIKVENNALIWSGVGTAGPFAGQPNVFITSLDGISVEKLA